MFVKKVKPIILAKLEEKINLLKSTTISAPAQGTERRPSTSTTKSGMNNPTTSNTTPTKSMVSRDGKVQSTERSGHVRKQTAILAQQSDEAAFFDEMRELAAYMATLDIKLDLHPKINGEDVSLFQLYNIVVDAAFGGFQQVESEGRWHEVVSQLRATGGPSGMTTQQIRDCYLHNLEDYEELRGTVVGAEIELTQGTVQDESATPLQGHDDDDSGLFVSADEDEEEKHDVHTLPPGRHTPQTSPELLIYTSGEKRTGSTSLNSQSSGHNKRQKVDKGKGRALEIPSTPEDNEVSKETDLLRGRSSPFEQRRVSDSKGDSDEGYLDPPLHRSLFTEKSMGQDLEMEDANSLLAVDDDGSISHDDGQSASARSHQPRLDDKTTSSPQGQDVSDDSDMAERARSYLQKLLTQGYESETIFRAMHATCMDLTHVVEVLESLESGSGVPKTIRGVWTSEDDDALGATASKSQSRDIILKHGMDAIKLRRRFLADLEKAHA